VYVFVQLVEAPGVSDVTGHVIEPTFASVTPTEVSVTLPEFVTTNVYRIVEPAVVPDGVPACLSNVIAGDRVIGVVTVLVPVTAVPVGGVPDAVAVLFTVPASTSACVSVYDFAHVVDAPGASVVAGQDTAPTFGSETPTLVSVTLPVFATTKVYRIVDPAVMPLGVPAVLATEIAGERVIGAFAVLVPVTADPVGGVPVAVAVLFTTPASTSACVSAYDFVHVVDAPGASVVAGQVTEPIFGSETPTLVSVTLPVFVTTNV
jgi:hypothetical protein